MGFFKQVKDMKAMVHEAPGLLEQSALLAENAKAQAAAHQAAAEAAQAQAAAQQAAPVAPVAPEGEA